MSTTIPSFIAQRNEAYRTLDVQWCKANLIPDREPSSDEVVLVAIHKARYETVSMGATLREESRKWLTENNYSRLHGIPWPPEGVLE